MTRYEGLNVLRSFEGGDRVTGGVRVTEVFGKYYSKPCSLQVLDRLYRVDGILCYKDIRFPSSTFLIFNIPV